MTKKAHNSLLLLTTLSVYLGLLVVGGAAPQVFAHSATTRVFEITEEIEFKNDLDLDPDKSGFDKLTDREIGRLRDHRSSEDNTFSIFQFVELPQLTHIQTGNFTAKTLVSDLGYDLAFNKDIFRTDLLSNHSSADRSAFFLNELFVHSESKYTRTETDLRKSDAGSKSFLHSNDKLLVVTALPRAALDAPLFSRA